MGEWIELKKEVPPETEDEETMYVNYLTYSSYIDVRSWYGKYDDLWQRLGITHWMPLPQPPEE